MASYWISTREVKDEEQIKITDAKTLLNLVLICCRDAGLGLSRQGAEKGLQEGIVTDVVFAVVTAEQRSNQHGRRGRRAKDEEDAALGAAALGLAAALLIGRERLSLLGVLGAFAAAGCDIYHCFCVLFNT